MMPNSDNEVQLKTLFKVNCQETGPIRSSPALIEVAYTGGVEVETIISHLQPVIETQVKEYLAAWKQTYQHPLSQCAAILGQFLVTLEELEPDTATIGDLWRELAVTLDAIYDWNGRLSQEVSASNPKRAWQKQFLASLQSMPEYAEIPIPPDCWIAKPDDSWQQRLRKAQERTRASLTQTILRLGNQFRCLFKARPLDPLPAHRKIQLHSFLGCYVGLPVAEFLLAQWLQFLQHLAGQLYELDTRTEAIKADFLPLDDFEAAISKFDPARLNHKLDSLQNQLQMITAQFERLDHFELEAGQKFDAFQADLYRNMRQQWHLAGTYQLADSSFDQKRVINGWRRIDSQVTDAHRQWLDHFRGQQGEWQAGLELSLLQLAAAQMCQHRLNSLEHRIRHQLIPTFATTRETVILLSEEITALKTRNPAALKQALAEQNRLILKVLQQDKLPGLMDELIAAQLAPAAESETAGSIRRALTAFSEEHQILSYRDLDNPLPKSTADNVLALKKLVLEYLLPEFEKGYQTVNAENRQLIEQLIRSISELDQVIEVNLKQATMRLARCQDPQAVEEIRLAIIIELNRTAQQLNELVAQAEQLLAASRNKLVQVTGDFENQLEHLTDSGQISEVYLQLAGKKGSGKIRIYRRKIFLTLKTAVPNLFGLLGSTFQQFQSSYARLREMAGPTAGKAEAQENLSQFLIETEKHIGALPYFYQRLFRLEPLSDDQFFAARARELAVLKAEFERWQNGRFATTAIIGERGSGITTLLNFAEQQFYKAYPVVKIDFLDGETIFTTQALFDFLKSIFRETDLKRGLKNLDELENKINALDEQKIFIVENLQQLFLRTPYGFDALERFLLFISRTHQKIHWVITCAIYSWEYLAKVISLDEYVQQKIFLHALSPADFINIILTRHRVSGYQLLFRPTDKIANSRRFKKLSSEPARQTYLQNLFFKQLTELAAGNITVAILLWLRSYKEFSQDRLIFPATIHFDPTFLYQLTTEELFTLAAVLQHDILTAQHHALIFHQDIQHSLLLLNRMANKGFLVQKPNGYQIHPFLYRPVVGVLKSGNIIH